MTFPNFLPAAASRLTEQTSIELARNLRREPLRTTLRSEAIATSFARQGTENASILLLHGFDSSCLEFRRLLPLLAGECETWAIDLLGFGFTERVPEIVISPENIKIHLHAFWQTYCNRPVVLVGASMGGAAAIDFTLSHPEAVEKLVLLDSAGYRSGPAIGRWLFWPFDVWAAEFLRNPNVRGGISNAAYYNKSWNSEDARQCAALHLEMSGWQRALISFTKSGGYGSFRQKLSQISRSTLILWGDKDEILGTKDTEKIQQEIPQSQLVWIRDCGHVPHLEKPQQTATEILQFALERSRF